MDRTFPKSLEKRWKDPKGLIQIFMGPRQVGKTTAASALMDPKKTIFASADLPAPPNYDFIVSHWEKARELPEQGRTLILDEVQKIPRWSEVVKKLWDEDQRNKTAMRVCLLGSSALLLEKGLSESLTGRFEVNFFPHWTYPEVHRVFGATLDEFARLGGYPKAYDLRDDPERAEEYIQNGVLEPTFGRDILALHSVDKPALLRQLFWYVSRLPAQLVSYEKILGHLQGKGNSATLVHYAELLDRAFLLKPIFKFSGRPHRTKKTIPKWIFPNPALVETSVKKGGTRGFVLENLVGSHLLNITFGQKEYELNYWRHNDREVDYVLTKWHEPVASFEVKSGRAKGIPHREVLTEGGIDCALYVITPENLETLLLASTIEDMMKALIPS